MIGAQAEPYYGMDDRYDSYEPEHPSEYTDNQYNTYEPREYPSDNNYKSEKDSKSVSINKLKCVNNNLNINGNNAGNISIGNKGEGYSGGYSYSGGYGDEGYSYQGKGSDCIINNNNNNTNVVSSSGGNQTIPPVVDECDEAGDVEACWVQFFNDENFGYLVEALATGIDVQFGGSTVTLNNFEDFCLLKDITFDQLRNVLGQIYNAANMNQLIANGFSFCIAKALGIPAPDMP